MDSIRRLAWEIADTKRRVRSLELAPPQLPHSTVPGVDGAPVPVVDAITDATVTAGGAAALAAQIEAAQGVLAADQAGLESAFSGMMEDQATLELAVLAAQTAAQTAAQDAQVAQTAADAAAADVLTLAGKTGRLIRSATEPTGDDRNVNNLWLDTDTGQIHEFTGTAWALITDVRLSDAITAADTAATHAQAAQASAAASQTLADQAAASAATASTASQQAAADLLAARSEAEAASASSSSAQSAAALAAQDAQQAADDALAAANAADGALITANTKGKVIFSTLTPPEADRLPQNLWIDMAGESNTPRRWDGSVWAPVTDKAAIDAAQKATTALSTAQDAQLNAQNAHTRANDAYALALGAQDDVDILTGNMSTLNGKVTISEANPTASDAVGKPLNALWEVRAGAVSLRRFVLTNLSPATWMQVKIGQDFIGANAIGSAQIADASIGTAEIADLAVTDGKIGTLAVNKLRVIGTGVDAAVIAELWAKVVRSQRITTDMLMVGAGENLQPDPTFIDAGLGSTPAIWPATYRTATGGQFGGGSIFFPSGSTARESLSTYSIPVTPGDSYRLKVYAAVSASGVGQGGVMARFYSSAGTFLTEQVVSMPAASSWIDGVVKAPDTAVTMRVGFHVTAAFTGRTARFSSLSVTRAMDASLFVDGIILATKKLIAGMAATGKRAELGPDGLAVFDAADRAVFSQDAAGNLTYRGDMVRLGPDGSRIFVGSGSTGATMILQLAEQVGQTSVGADMLLYKSPNVDRNNLVLRNAAGGKQSILWLTTDDASLTAYAAPPSLLHGRIMATPGALYLLVHNAAGVESQMLINEHAVYWKGKPLYPRENSWQILGLLGGVTHGNPNLQWQQEGEDWMFSGEIITPPSWPAATWTYVAQMPYSLGAGQRRIIAPTTTAQGVAKWAMDPGTSGIQLWTAAAGQQFVPIQGSFRVW